MPPWWKIRREINRIFLTQLPSLLETAYTWFLGWLHYDLLYKKHRVITIGKKPLGNNICVYVIFPGENLRSHLATLKHLKLNDFSVVVVSNKSLLGSQRDLLLSESSVLIERINFGYDFGGYREGYLWLRENTSNTPRFLLYLNDSCWFPTHPNSDWLQKAMGLKIDYCSPITSSTIKKRAETENFDDWWHQDKHSKNFHYCSFALLISGRVYADHSFFQYFRYFPLTNRKNRTVRRGEIGLTKWILKSGYSHGETFNIESLLEDFRHLSKAELVQVLEQITLIDDLDLNRRKHYLEQRLENSDEKEILGFILYVIARQGAAYSVPTILMEKYKFAFLKKSLQKYNEKNQQILLEFLASPEHESLYKLFVEANPSAPL